jgi:hypothetical protein
MDEIDCSRIALKHYMADRGAQSNLAHIKHILA